MKKLSTLEEFRYNSILVNKPRFLKINLYEAKSLPAMDVNGKAVNFYKFFKK